MLKREINYEDFNGNQSTDICYFNISKPELMELEVSYSEGFGTLLQNIVDTKDNKELVRRFKEIILMSYGQKSDDGKRFVKSDELCLEFSQTAAFQSLFMELASNENAAVEFLTGVLPRDMRNDIEKASIAPTPTTPPLPPTN